MAQLAEGSYRFSAEPRVVKAGEHIKYRDPGQQGQASNIMFDKRVIRGNTYAAMVVPQSQQQELERQQEMAKKKRKRKQTSQQKQQASQSQREVSTPEPVQGRKHEEAQTEKFLEELTDKPPEYEIETQTDFYIDRPPTPHFIPIKRGEDIETQIEDGELFDFDREVQPILEVLCGKTLEQARMEVLEEEELEAMRKHQREFQQIRDAELAEVQRLEAQEKRKKEEADRRKLQQRARIEQQQTAHQKFCSRIYSKKYLTNLQKGVFRHLSNSGYFRDPLTIALYDQFVPWLLDQSQDLNSLISCSDKIIQQLETNAQQQGTAEHSRSILNEFNKRENERLQKLKLAKEKEERKKQRDMNRKAFKRQLYIDSLREQIYNEIIDIGDVREKMLDQIFTDGDYRVSEKIVGTPGGLFGEFLCLIAVMEDIFEKSWDFEQLLDFIQAYVTEHMKQEIFEFTNINVNEVNTWLENLKIPQEDAEDLQVNLDNLNELPEPLFIPFLEIVMDPQRNFNNTALTTIFRNTEKFGIRQDLIRGILLAFYKLMTLKDTTEVDNSQLRNKIRLTELPGIFFIFLGMESQSIKPKAVARIRIPIIRPGQEEGEMSGEEDQNENSKDKSKAPSKVQQEAEEEVEHEAEIIDQVLLIHPRAPSGLAVYVSHQAAQRFLRKDLALFVQNYITKNEPELKDKFEQEAVFKKIDERMQNWEQKIWETIDPELPIIDFEIN